MGSHQPPNLLMPPARLPSLQHCEKSWSVTKLISVYSILYSSPSRPRYTTPVELLNKGILLTGNTSRRGLSLSWQATTFNQQPLVRNNNHWEVHDSNTAWKIFGRLCFSYLSCLDCVEGSWVLKGCWTSTTSEQCDCAASGVNKKLGGSPL